MLKKLIIYSSKHHGNTEKVAKAMAESINADIMRAGDVVINALDAYQLIGFGSGIYGGRMDKSIIELLDKLPAYSDKKAFVFSTSGIGKDEYNDSAKQKLQEKGFEIIGSFACKGYDTFGPFKLVGGIAKGRPDDDDIQKAKNFVLEFIKYA
jgi:flavodoxin